MGEHFDHIIHIIIFDDIRIFNGAHFDDLAKLSCLLSPDAPAGVGWGFPQAVMVTDVNDLWIEEGGRVEWERNYIKEVSTVDDNYSASTNYIVSVPKDEEDALSVK